jgi:hypothetical protein
MHLGSDPPFFFTIPALLRYLWACTCSLSSIVSPRLDLFKKTGKKLNPKKDEWMLQVQVQVFMAADQLNQSRNAKKVSALEPLGNERAAVTCQDLGDTFWMKEYKLL